MSSDNPPRNKGDEPNSEPSATSDNRDAPPSDLESPGEKSPNASIPSTRGMDSGRKPDIFLNENDRCDRGNEPPVMIPGHELIRCVGSGGFGEVWLARHTLTEYHRACKLIPANRAVELDGLKQLKRRVPTHPNLFPIDDVGEISKWLYVLMPLADNANSGSPVLDHTGYEPMTLKLHIRRTGERLPPDEVIDIGVHIAEAVEQLHSHGVTHGDIKPANIMRLAERWTLGDYGLARDMTRPTGPGHTPGYIPPEGPGSTAADQYALGVVLFQMLTGWTARNLSDFRTSPNEKLKLGGQGKGLRDVILTATSDEPKNRFASMRDLEHALRACAEPAVDRKSAKKRWSMAVVATVILIVVTLIAWPLLPIAGRSDTEKENHAVTSPLAVNSFDVVRYHYIAERDETEPLGPINADNPAAMTGDDVTIHTELSSPAYCYLLSLDTNGVVKLRVPESDKIPPKLIELIDYPCRPNKPEDILYGLTDGDGVQGFMLLASIDPLPAWDEWVADHGLPRWNPEEVTAPLIFDGKELLSVGGTRGDPRPVRGRLKLGPIDWVRSQKELSAVRLIAFPVLPKEGN